MKNPDKIWSFSEYFIGVIQEECTIYDYNDGCTYLTIDEYIEKNKHLKLGVNAFKNRKEAEERLKLLQEYNKQLSNKLNN